MNDLIDRQEAIEALKKQMSDWNDLYNIPVRRSIVILEQLPSAQPERKKGKWIPQDYNIRNGSISTCVYYYPVCSECGKSGSEDYSYCPHCGADMGGKQNE